MALSVPSKGFEVLAWEQWHQCGDYYDGYGIFTDPDAWVNPRTPVPMVWGGLNSSYNYGRRHIRALEILKANGSEDWRGPYNP